ncbi:zinc ribbon domain-containing protein [Collinsella phocaeensis]|uniref:zinc ribbon domain-containing protein n=1 Tax=Collinsella phocaeensis TaxID=1871016 RepID=UPI00093141C6|nr:zinc ribbon domain-containing protein [Collinsella phocaeensis]
MICPHCLKTIDANETFCPHCHAFVGDSSYSEFVFCDGCGARLSSHDRTCPKCGRPAPGILSTESASADLAAGKTASFPRLSAPSFDEEAAPSSVARALDDAADPSETNILDLDELDRAQAVGSPKGRSESKPAPHDPYHSDKPSRKGLVIGLAAVLLIAAGAYLVVRDPLGVMPGAYEWFDRAAADAFPSRQQAEDSNGGGADEEPASTDGESESAETVLTDDEVYAALSRAYQQIESYDADEAFGEVIDSFNGFYLSKSLQERTERSASAFSLRDQIDQTIADLEGLRAPEDTVYAEDIQHMIQLAQWMRGRVDQICASWEVSLSVPDGESLKPYQDEILAPMRRAGSSDLDNFDAHFLEWEPERK